ncbi:hypothetical protein B0E53_04011 [Micromonospora sp. MH33]|nr:hypothetical protein B0E53_04011 [Micromonospora sp. MH33]
MVYAAPAPSSRSRKTSRSWPKETGSPVVAVPRVIGAATSPAPAISRASPATVRVVNRSRKVISRPVRAATAPTTLMASRECPPRAKKSSSMPGSATPSTSLKMAASCRSSSVAGSRRPAPAAYVGSGRAARSTLPLWVSGSSSRTTTAAGTR